MPASHLPASDTPLIHLAIASPDPRGLPVVTGVPLPKGMVSDVNAMSIEAPDGRPCPVAARPMIRWPDGSVRWALVHLLARQKGPHRVHLSPDSGVSGQVLENPVTLAQHSDAIELDNGLVSVVLSSTGSGPIRSLVAAGHAFLTDPESLELRVDDASSRHESQRTFRVLESSPLRCRVRIEGAHHRPGAAADSRRLSYRLDVELWAGQSTLRLDYHFFNLEPGSDTLPIDEIAMAFRFNLPGDSQRHFLQRGWGIHTRNREVHNANPVTLVADSARKSAYVADPSMLLDDTDYPFYLRPPRVATDEWMGICSTDRRGPSVYARMMDFTAMRPKRLSSEGNRLTLEVWPSSAGTLQLPQGRSRRQTLILTFSDQPTLTAQEATSGLNACLHEGRACVDHGWLARCGEFGQDRVMEPGCNVRFEKFIHRLMRLDQPHGMFDFGDTQDAGYRSTYACVGNVERRPDTPTPEPTYLASGRIADWADTYERVWANNEYDAIHALASEIMRTRRPELWPVLNSLARHNIEVDFVYYSDHKALHRATPAHSARHTTTGAYPSHYWTQGLLQYYCMTGDQDALEVATALGDKIIANFSDPDMRRVLWGFSRELGWPVLALSYLADLTGEERFHRLLDEIVDFLVGYDRQSAQGAVHLSTGNALRSFSRQMIDGFFGFASMVEGIDHYLQHRDRSDVADWFKPFLGELHDALVEAHHDGASLSPTHHHPLGMSIAYERLGNVQCLATAMVCLHELMDLPAWQQPAAEVKPVAMIYRSYMRFFHHIQTLGWLDRLDYPQWNESSPDK